MAKASVQLQSTAHELQVTHRHELAVYIADDAFAWHLGDVGDFEFAEVDAFFLCTPYDGLSHGMV